jgi:hypothetical protein
MINCGKKKMYHILTLKNLPYFKINIWTVLVWRHFSYYYYFLHGTWKARSFVHENKADSSRYIQSCSDVSPWGLCVVVTIAGIMQTASISKWSAPLMSHFESSYFFEERHCLKKVLVEISTLKNCLAFPYSVILFYCTHLLSFFRRYFLYYQRGDPDFATRAPYFSFSG